MYYVYMLKVERQAAIVDLLRVKGSLSVSQIVNELEVSPSTARRDLIDLQESGRVGRTWGGARLIDQVDDPFEEALERQTAAKQSIGTAAAELVPDGAAVYIDVGTTCYNVAASLVRRNVVVVTASLPTFEMLRKQSRPDRPRICLVGGEWSERYMCFSGNDVVSVLERRSIDIAFIGCSGIDQGGRVRDNSSSQTTIKQAVLAASARSYVLADARKFPGKGAYIPFAVSDTAGIITDVDVLPPTVKELRVKNRIEVINV
ncbi:DeoR/GlpR family DNA-binding transcription regulator [Gleimia hominis]|uniref:DeoR/GlpR family DNA-binding transcription regulator n=1 Tax=Gleimia hominis TaxID=595468 RepID=UPI000C8099E4|nr:DeoR/GlpR family DNA-binding transcription regulator [Gleimia hominis]WIK64715.1 DeoR/GlpR family DNA-binding transcription regulator [Gleimia hominis]